jgi:hypothetical protein
VAVLVHAINVVLGVAATAGPGSAILRDFLLDEAIPNNVVDVTDREAKYSRGSQEVLEGEVALGTCPVNEHGVVDVVQFDAVSGFVAVELVPLERAVL